MANTSTTLKSRILLRNGTSQELASSSIILKKGELAWASDTGVFKIGDGQKTWSEITTEYKDFAAVQSAINTAVQDLSKTDVYELEVNRGADKIVAINQEVTAPKKGDIAIVKEAIQGTTQKQYTAYVYSGSAWVAMDGNYDASNVIFAENITATYAFGKYTPDSSGSVTIPAQGKSLEKLFKDSYAEAKNPSVTQPSANITLTGAGAKEAGTKVTPSYTASLSAGSYQFGPATGVTATAYSITDTISGHEAQTGATGSFPELQVTDGMNYRLTAEITHTAGAVPKNNLGDEVPALKIAAGTKTKTSSSITAYRNSFYGSVTSKEGTPTSAIIRGLAGKSGKTNQAGNTFKAAEAVGAMRVIVAVPAPITCTSIKDENGLNAEAISAFTHTTVNVEGANGYSAKSYNVYYKDNAEACNKANNWVVTLG